MNRIAFLLKTPLQLKAYAVKIRAFQILAVKGRIRCNECGDHRWDVLQADHRDNDGHFHRKQIGKGGKGAGKRVYHWIIRNPAKARGIFQLLCANCHQLRTSYDFVPLPIRSDE